MRQQYKTIYGKSSYSIPAVQWLHLMQNAPPPEAIESV